MSIFRTLEHQAQGLGDRPALVVVDVVKGFTDPACPLGSPADDVVAANVALIQKAGVGSAGPDDQSSVRRKRNKARMVKTSTKISNAAISPDTAA